MLKRAVKKRYRKEGLPKTEARMIQITKEEWDNLDWEKIYNFIGSMPHRIKAIIELEGERTKY